MSHHVIFVIFGNNWAWTLNKILQFQTRKSVVKTDCKNDDEVKSVRMYQHFFKSYNPYNYSSIENNENLPTDC